MMDDGLVCGLYWFGFRFKLKEYLYLVRLFQRTQFKGAEFKNSLDQTLEISPINKSRLYKFLLDNPHWQKDVAQWTAVINNQGGLCLNPLSEAYPKAFLNLDQPPLILSVQGNICWQERPMLSVVGSRNPSRSSLMWMDQELSSFAKKTNSILVSGGARGVDQKAHSVSLRLNQPTISFIPAGLGAVYPFSFQEWISRIIECGGAVVSQYHPQQEMRKFHFTERNELIAALSPMSLIVEARQRSGTLITARAAMNMGNVVGVLPHFPGSQTMGGLNLLYDGAQMIRDHQDLMSHY